MQLSQHPAHIVVIGHNHQIIRVWVLKIVGQDLIQTDQAGIPAFLLIDRLNQRLL